MSKNELQEDLNNNGPTFFIFKGKDNLTKINIQKTYIYGNKDDSLYEDIFFKQMEAINPNYFAQNKSSVELNLTENNLHEFLNQDLIKALNNDSIEPKENLKKTDSPEINANAYILRNSEFNSYSSASSNSLTENVNNTNINLNKKDDLKNNIFDIDNDLPMNQNVDNCEMENDTLPGDIIRSLDKILDENENIKDNIEILNNPLFTPMVISKGVNDINKNKKRIEYNEKLEKKKERKNNLLKNKFDDDVEPMIMLSKLHLEDKTKLPSEIRAGDWICLYCNNLNFSFRIKCNRCGLLRKSSHLLKKKNHNTNKYYCFENQNQRNFNGEMN